MNKKPLLIIGVIVVVIIASITFLVLSSNKSSNTQVTSESSQASEQNVADQEVPTATDQQGAYVDYSSDVIANTTGTKVLFFHAPWCPQCRALESDIKNQTIPEGVTIIKVDYDSNQALRQKYGVTIQTTLVKVDDNGELVEKYVAYNEPTFTAVKENLL